MARIRFETGQVVNFEGTPTQADVDEVATKLGIGEHQQKTFPQKAKEFGLGAAKSLVETAKEALETPAQIGRMIPEPVKRVAPSLIPGMAGFPIAGALATGAEKLAQKIPEKTYTAQTPEEKAGKLVGTIGQALIPVGGGAVKALKPVGTILEKAGEKILSTVIRPTQADVRAGFKIGNVAKHDVGGSLPEMLTKTSEKIKANVDQVKERLKATPYNANVDDVITQTEERLKKGGLAKFGNIGSLEKAMDDVRAEIGRLKEQGLIGADGTVSVADLQEIKQAAGLQGAWNYGRPDRDAKALETVYNQFYLIAKEEIEKKSPQGIKELNKTLSELIPIQHAIIRRLPVAERNNPISLTDVITLTHSFTDPKTLSLYILNKLSKSGKAGEALIKGGQKLQSIFPKDRGAILPTKIRKIEDARLKSWFEGPEGEIDVAKITQRLAEKHKGKYDIHIVEGEGKGFIESALKPGALPQYIQNIIQKGVKKGYYENIDDVHGLSFPYGMGGKRPIILSKGPYIEQRTYHEIGHHIGERMPKESKELLKEIDYNKAKQIGLIGSEFAESPKETIAGVIRVFYSGTKEQRIIAGDLLKKYGMLSIIPMFIPYKDQR